jgi:ferredoxin
MEIESAFTQSQAVAEAARCLECGCQDVKECKIKEYATDYDALARRFLGEVAVHPIDDSHPFISRDPSKCILCGRCVRICLEVQGIGVFGYIYRGFSSVVAPSFGTAFGQDSSCISCGQCVSSCPVGALTEKLPAVKNVPLDEDAREGYCSLCSMSCALEYRSHGSLFTRVTGRFEAPSSGNLCKKGKFGHDFLAAPPASAPAGSDGKALSMHQAAQAAALMMSRARSPLMRVSPSLCGEAIDIFLSAAAAKKIPAVAAGLEALDPGWAALGNGGSGSGGFFADGPAPGAVAILVGDISSSNNVAFTEAYRMRRKGLLDLWIVGHDDEVSRRVASRVVPELDRLGEVASSARADSKPLDILVNPEEIHRAHGSAGEKAVLQALGKAASGARVTLLWNSRNGGYLFGKLAAAAAPVSRARPSKASGGKPDLLLDVGVEDGGQTAQRIVWGMKTTEGALFLPLPRELWLRGRSYPSGRGSLEVDSVDEEAIRELAALI